VPDYVTFYGKLRKNKDDELKKLIECYASHDIFIMPTKAECAGIVFAEAAMFGLPSFTYATGGTTDYVEDGVTGKCLNPESGPADYSQEIIQAIQSGSIEAYSVNARKKYENELNWDKWLEHFEALINRL
jgi:glycosyltransferase involved in cell wall biosynthesis